MKGSIATVALLAGAAAALPAKRAAGITDAQILNYALTLEHLEATFYAEGLKNFTEAQFAAEGFSSVFYQNLQEVAKDEATHVAVLTAALKAVGQPAVAACTYNFPVTDPKSLIATASVLEGVGVSAYLGAAMDIMNKTYLTDAGSILTVEARHSAYIRSQLDESPFAAPFDVPLDPDEVYTLAHPFIAACPPSNPPLPVKAFPALTLDMSTPSPVAQGATALIDSASPLTECTVYAAFITVTGPVFTKVTSADNGAGMKWDVVVPGGLVAGQSYVVFSSSSSTINDETVLAGPAVVEVSSSAGA